LHPTAWYEQRNAAFVEAQERQAAKPQFLARLQATQAARRETKQTL